MRQQDKKNLNTIGKKADDAVKTSDSILKEIFKLRKENRKTFTQIMWGGVLIFLGTFLYDFIARLITHKYTEGWGRDQFIVMGIGFIIALWGLWRR